MTEYLQLYAEDEDGKNMEMDELINEENAQDRDFIDDVDTDASFSAASCLFIGRSIIL